MLEVAGVLICAAFLAYPRIRAVAGAVSARLQPAIKKPLVKRSSGKKQSNRNRSATKKMRTNTVGTFQERIEQNAPPWFSYVAYDEGCGNVLIAGRKGSGKSTLAYTLLACRAKAGQKVLVLDPHANFNDWPIPAIGGGRDFAAIEQALQSLMQEFHRRYQLGKNDVLEPLTIFIDEMPSIKEFCPSAKQFFLAGAREFRKINMTLVILTQSANVKTLGIEGEGDSKLNFVLIHLAGKAIDRMPNEPALRQFTRPGVIEQDGFCYPVDLSQPFITRIAELPVSSESVWQPEKDVLDFNLLADSSQSSGAFGIGSEGGTDGNYSPEPLPELPELDAERVKMEALAIRSLADAGYSRTAIAKYLGGRKADTLAKIKFVLENGEVA